MEPADVNVRIKISALWASMLFVFAYVDLFSLYRPDFRADLEVGEIGGFTRASGDLAPLAHIALVLMSCSPSSSRSSSAPPSMS